uniref:Uncharacterized protein n=1 Tax=Magallana gigas TaxID=29159 RepID=A0A8W8KF98_MAGGI
MKVPVSIPRVLNKRVGWLETEHGISTPVGYGTLHVIAKTVQTFLFPGNREFCKYIQHPDWLQENAMTLENNTDMKNRRESRVSLVSMDRKYSIISNASLKPSQQSPQTVPLCNLCQGLTKQGSMESDWVTIGVFSASFMQIPCQGR